MKNRSLCFGLLCLLFLAFGDSLEAQTPGTTFYGVQAVPVCWRTPGGVDSTIFQVSLSPAGATKPTQMFFYVPIVGTAKVFPVTVAGGRIRPGSCAERQNLLDNDTIIINLSQIIEDNDTIINLLELIAGGASDTTHIVSEVGCLTLSAMSCPISGLGAGPSSQVPPLGGTVYFNLSYLGTMTSPGSCENIANFMNANDPNNGEWGCCADTLIVNSLDTSLYQQININWFGNSYPNTVYNFNDTIGGGDYTNTFSVEIIKVINSLGEIIDLRVFSPDGTVEYTNLSGLTTGPCADQSLTANISNSLANIVTLLGGDCTLSDEVRLTSITSNTTYSANTLNSISILPLSGTITVNTDGSGAVTLENGTEYWFAAEGCNYINTDIVVGVTSGVVQISRYY